MGIKFVNLCLVFAVMLSLTACNPFKVTDPSDPRFDPMKFEFEDYNEPKKIGDTLRRMFPQGTDIKEIEKVFLNIEGVKKFERELVIENVKKRNDNYKASYVYIYTPPTIMKRLPLIIRSTMALNPMEVYRVIVDVDNKNKSLHVITTY